MSERAPGRPSAAAARPPPPQCRREGPLRQRLMSHFHTPPLPEREPAAGRAGAPLTARRGGQGRRPHLAVASAAAEEEEEEEEERERRGGEAKKKKKKKPNKTWRRVLLAVWRWQRGAAGGAAGGDCVPRAPTTGRAGPHRPAGDGGVCRAESPPPPVLLLLRAQEFLNFKEQVTATCPPLSLGHRKAAGPRPASALPCRRASGERERERKGAFMRTTKLQIWLPSLSCLITAKK